MATGDKKKTKQQLIAELEALREQLEAGEAIAEGGEGEAEARPSLSFPMTRRTSLKSWIAPVVLSIPLSSGLAASSYTAPPIVKPLATRRPFRCPAAFAEPLRGHSPQTPST